MFQVQDLSFRYSEHPILSGLSFKVRQGELCGLFGPNGCGKTTLFKCCLRFLRFDGHIRIAGHDTRSLNARTLAKKIAYVPQEHRPPFPYTVFEVVLMARTPHMGSGIFGISSKDKARVLTALDSLGILDLARLPYTQLSGGQRQLVLIARALAQDTAVILLDEPTSSLDFQNQVRVWQVLRQIAREGTTILACSHDPNHVAWFCDRVVMLHDRQIVADGRPADVFDEALLNLLYQDSCRVVSIGSQKVVLPQCNTN